MEIYDWDRYNNPRKPSNIRLRQIVERDLEKYLKQSSVFELAAGTGYWGRYLLDLGYEYKGLEITPAMVEWAHRRGVTEESLGDASDSRSYPKEVDNIICIKAFTFFREPIGVLLNCKKSLKKDGRLMMWYYNKDFHILRLLLHLQGTSIEELTPLEIRYSWKDMKKMLRDSGFRLLDMKDYINFSYRFIPKFLRDNKVVHWVDDHLKYGWITFLVAEKI